MNSATESTWTDPEATLSDRLACREFGLNQKQILAAVKNGRLQHREESAYGRTSLLLIRSEVVALASNNRGADYLATKKTKTELLKVERELRKLQSKMGSLERRRDDLRASLDGGD